MLYTCSVTTPIHLNRVNCSILHISGTGISSYCWVYLISWRYLLPLMSQQENYLARESRIQALRLTNCSSMHEEFLTNYVYHIYIYHDVQGVPFLSLWCWLETEWLACFLFGGVNGGDCWILTTLQWPQLFNPCNSTFQIWWLPRTSIKEHSHQWFGCTWVKWPKQQRWDYLNQLVSDMITFQIHHSLWTGRCLKAWKTLKVCTL